MSCFFLINKNFDTLVAFCRRTCILSHKKWQSQRTTQIITKTARLTVMVSKSLLSSDMNLLLVWTPNS
ncbi:unnamed protein product [Colias eurytheme]|nr:unnamed protein product [Colias eurytheme]